jgi:hypothetical protein
MKQRPILVAIAAAALLACGLAKAETITCDRQTCKVHQVTADRLIAERQLACTYGKPRFITINGAAVRFTPKVCK